MAAGDFSKSLDEKPKVRLYEIGAQGQSQGKAMYSHEAPVLSVCWNKVRIIGLSVAFATETFSGMAGREQSLLWGSG